MIKIDQHISDLLFRYDCVIVPELGGFVANYAPAKIHPTQHTFTPPSKNIVFNKNLHNNDGLLANHLANKERKTYTEANKVIGQYVESCNDTLKSGKKINIEKVGTLFLNVERNIQFEPDRTVNYLTDAFGLTTFQSPAIKREGYVPRLEKEFKDRTVAPPQPKRKINVRRYVALAVALPLLFAAIWVPIKTDLLKNVNYSNLNPFVEREKPLYTVNNSTYKVITENDLKKSVNLLSENDTSALVNISPVKDIPESITVRLKEEVIPQPQQTKVDNTKVALSDDRKIGGKRSYHIVAGCFRVIENARNFVAQLKGKNLDAVVIGKNENGLNVVSVGDYATRGEAQREMARIKAVNPEVWLMKK